jgi:phosphopantetheinyl transferase
MAFFFQADGLTLVKLNSFEALNKVQLKTIQRSAIDSILFDLNLNDQISFSENGKPLLKDHRSISISNDEKYCGVYVSNYPCGLDIQTATPKVLRIKNKFCNEQELAWATSEEDFTTIWCIKEAIFKVYGTQVPFADSITTYAFTKDQETLTAEYSGVHGNHLFHLCRMQVDSTFVVYTDLKK